jgi:hypothetical protein
MRTAYLLFPEDARFREIPVQVKQNRRTVGLPPGFFVDADLIRHATAHTASTNTTLSAVVGRGPFVIISGSLT